MYSKPSSNSLIGASHLELPYSGALEALASGKPCYE